MSQPTLACGGAVVSLRFKDRIFLNDTILAVVCALSSLTLTEVPGRSTVQLDAGRLAVAVAKEWTHVGEKSDVGTPNGIARLCGADSSALAVLSPE